MRRRFVRVEDRAVHYIRAGEGPPVVLLHYAEVSAASLLPLVEMLAGDHTVFAFDHPGHGDSDPLGKDELDVAEIADALSATLAALDMPPCPVYGTHTGAAVALELGHRHPEQVSGLVIDGPCMFEPWEEAALLNEGFMPDVGVRHDGSHLYSTWVRMRDGITWLPWNLRQRKWRFTYFLPGPDVLHHAFIDMVRGGDACWPVYGAAITDGREVAAELTVPATYMASDTDILYEHLDRLPDLKDNQEIVRVSTGAPDFFSGMGEHLTRAAEIVRKYRVEMDAPADPPFRPSQGAVNRRYVDLPDGQVLVRSAGEDRSGTPLVLLHDGRGSSRVLEPLMRVLANRRPTYALDLPGNGASDPHPSAQPEIGDYADSVEATIRELGLESPDVYAAGAGAAVALELATRSGVATGGIVLEAPDFYATAFSNQLAADWVPPVEPSWDGSHLTRLWLMLRDEYAFWPWFDQTPDAVYNGDAPTDWNELHARVVEMVRSLPTYHLLTMAALRYDWLSALTGLEDSAAVLAVTATDPRRPHVEAAAGDAGAADPVVLPDRLGDRAAELLRILER